MTTLLTHCPSNKPEDSSSMRVQMCLVQNTAASSFYAEIKTISHVIKLFTLLQLACFCAVAVRNNI